MAYIFTWVPVYHTICDKLADYAGREDELAGILTQLGVDTTDEEVPGQKVPLDDIDPLSFISCLNKFSDERAMQVLRRLCALWNIDAKPFDIAGVPRTDPRRAYMFPFKKDRTDEIDRLWAFFQAFRENRLNDAVVDDVLRIKGVGWPKLTEGLFMLSPERFLCINGMVRPYLEHRGINPSFTTFTGYLQLLERITSKIPEPFYAISHNSFRWKEANDRTPKYWRIGTTAGHKGATVLPEMLREEVASIGWNELGDLAAIEPFNQGAIRDKLFELGTYENRQTASVKAGEIFKFKQQIRVNDFIAACEGGIVLSIGQVLHDQYIYLPDLDFAHCRAVDWIKPNVYGLKITGTLQSVNEIYHEEDIAKIKDYLNQEANWQITSENNSPVMENLSVNTIFYGPPGTGKTHRMQALIEQHNLIETGPSARPAYTVFVADYYWWQLIAMALLESQEATVPQLLEHPLIQAKLAISNIQHPPQRVWSTLQNHTVLSCPHVKLQEEKRHGDLIFFKNVDSVWRLDNPTDFKQQFPYLVSEWETYRNGSDSEGKATKHYTFTTCHQSLSYEDFVEGIKPVLSNSTDEEVPQQVQYEIRKGLFYQACELAAQRAGFNSLKDALSKNKEERKEQFSKAIEEGRIHVLFLDEINRTNVSAVFGELITLIEDNKRLGADNEIADTLLPYSQTLFGVPANLFIVGTMNTADRSVEALDTALRRRFSFLEMQPDEKHTGIKDKVAIGSATVNFQTVLSTINRRIEKLVGRDHKIGHTYFLAKEDWTWKNYLHAFTDKIIPLLQEYFYGDWAKMCLVTGEGFVRLQPRENSESFFAPLSGNNIAIKDSLQDLEEKEVWVLTDWRDKNEDDFANALKQLAPNAVTPQPAAAAIS